MTPRYEYGPAASGEITVNVASPARLAETITARLRDQVRIEPPRCATCLHWEHAIDDVGICDRIELEVGWLNTAPDFGCTLYEPRPLPKEPTK